jgi:hypothetical protein
MLGEPANVTATPPPVPDAPPAPKASDSGVSVSDEDVVAMLGEPANVTATPPPVPDAPPAPKASDSGVSVSDEDVVAMLGEPAAPKAARPPVPDAPPAPKASDSGVSMSDEDVVANDPAAVKAPRPGSDQGGKAVRQLDAGAEPEPRAAPEETSTREGVQAAADRAAKDALRDGSERPPLTKKPSWAVKPGETAAAGSARKASTTPARVEIHATPEVEEALRWLLKEKHTQLMSARVAKKVKQEEGVKEKGPTTTWAGRLLEIVDRQLQKAENQGKLLIADMFKNVLDPMQPVAEERRMEVADFCREVVNNTGRLAFGREAKRRQHRRVAQHFAQQLLDRFGRASEAVDVAQVYGGRPTLAQIIAKMDPERTRSPAVQQRALDLLAEELVRQTRVVRQQRDPAKRAAQIGECNKAITMARQTKAYREGMDAEKRKAYEGNLSSLEQRLNRNPETGLPERMK